MLIAARTAGLTLLALALAASAASAQQRPLLTEDPEAIGAGRVLIEGGVGLFRGQLFTVSGLEGNVLRIPSFGVSVGLSSIAELQIDGVYERLSITKRRPAPLADMVSPNATTTSTFDEVVVATKIRIAAERPGHPGFGVRFATRLPTPSNASGIGLDTTDFYASLLVGKTVQSIRIVGNGGVAILTNPIRVSDQNDLLTYGVSVARAVSNQAELVGEINGRLDTRNGPPETGTENQGAMRFGGRFTKGTVRLDAGIVLGFTSRDPSIGLTVGFTYVFDAFHVP